jgi:hypothetical protein
VGADGHAFPTFIMHPFLNLPDEYKRCVSDRFKFIHVQKGFIDREKFEYIFENMVIIEIERRRKEITNLSGNRALVISDGHSSRLSVKVMNLARKHNVDIFILPSHLTHILQPLDCGINRTFKYEIGSYISADECHGTSENKSAFIQSLCSMISKTLIMGGISNAWKNSGLHPFNPSRILHGHPFFAPKSTSQTPRGILMVCGDFHINV